MADVRDLVIARSTGRCEAMVELPRTLARCGKRPVEDHHMLTRSRGGDVLDKVGEIYHHIALCGAHHRWAHRSGERDLMMEGYVTIEAGRVVYTGPDEYLTEKYGKHVDERPARLDVEVPLLQEALRHSRSGSAARGEM